MLLRSSSTPKLNSCLPHSKDCSSPEPDFPVLQRTRSVSFYSTSSIDDHKQKLKQTLADINIQNDTPKPRKKRDKAIIPAPHSLDKQAKQESDQEKESEPNFCSIQRLFSSSGLGEKTVDGKDSNVMQTLVMGGGAGNDGGKICGGGAGGGSDGGDDSGGSGFFDSNNHGSDGTDVYYQKMIEANPGNSLLLGNYAKFLKDVREILKTR